MTDVFKALDAFFSLINKENIENLGLAFEIGKEVAPKSIKDKVSDFKYRILPHLKTEEEANKAIEDLLIEIGVSSHLEHFKTQGLINTLIEKLEEPIFKQQLQYQKYIAYLKTEYDSEDLFNKDEATLEKKVLLSDLYVEPQFSAFLGREKEEFRQDLDLRDFKPCRTSTLPQAIMGILDGKNPIGVPVAKQQPQFILLLGQPGQGKSSFCKRFLRDYITQMETQDDDKKQKIYYIRLRDITDTEGLERTPYDKLKSAIEEQMRIILDESCTIELNDLENAILLLDGLDELQMVKEKAFDDGVALRFCEVLIEKLRARFKKDKLYPKIIVTSRFGRVNPSDIKADSALVLRLDNLTIEQQKAWLKKYYNASLKTWLTYADIEKFNTDSFNHIKELLVQPILLNMVAQLPQAPNDDIKKTDLYKILFDTLIERKYSDTGTLNIHKNILPPEKLKKLLQEVGFAVFKSGKEYIHYEELIQTDLPQLKHFLRNSNEIKDKKEALRGLMMSFYTQERRKNTTDNFKEEALSSDYAIEFVHKSFQEYLAAEFIYESVKQLFNNMFNDEDDYNAQKPERLLELLNHLFAKQRLSREIVDNLIEIIESKKDNIITAKEVQNLSERLAYFFEPLFNTDFLYIKWNDKSINGNTFPVDQCTNTFYGYWTLLSFTSSNLKEQFDQFKTKAHYIYERFIFFIQIGRGTYYRFNLRHADLSYADLSYADLSYTSLSYADLSYTSLRHASLFHADLRGADLNEADLRGADLRDADLSYAKLKEADLRGADLRGADLRGADLRGADLNEADLRGADLRDADLSYAKLNEADLRGANLFGATELDENTLKILKAKGAIIDDFAE